MIDNMTATQAQKRELIVQALGIAGFERVGDMELYTQEHGMKKTVVDLTAGTSVYFMENKQKVVLDDEDDTLAKVSKMITEAEDGLMPSRTEPDMVVTTTMHGAEPAPQEPARRAAQAPADPGHTTDNPLTDGSSVPKLSSVEIVHSTAITVPSDLSVSTIKKYINDKATDEEAYVFLQLCKARGLNPFLKEAYLIKYDHVQPATMVVGKDAFMKRAESHIEYDGFEAGIIVESGNSDDYVVVDDNRVGTFLRDGETLLGGWAKVYRKDHTRPVEITVSMKEFNTGKSSWKKMPATMIRKVALVNALRESFPSELSGMYDSSEMGVEFSV